MTLEQLEIVETAARMVLVPELDDAGQLDAGPQPISGSIIRNAYGHVTRVLQQRATPALREAA